MKYFQILCIVWAGIVILSGVATAVMRGPGGHMGRIPCFYRKTTGLSDSGVSNGVRSGDADRVCILYSTDPVWLNSGPSGYIHHG